MADARAADRVKEARVRMSAVLALLVDDDGAWTEAYRLTVALGDFENSLRKGIEQMTEYSVTVTVEVEMTVAVEAVSPAKAAELATRFADEAGARANYDMPHVELADISTGSADVQEMYDEDGDEVSW
jgi:hypothetical protein